MESNLPTEIPERPQIGKMNYSHDAMVDLIISNPGITQNRLAQYFGYSPSWVSTVMASDAFKVQLAKRKHELVDPTLTATIEERFAALAEVSVTKLMDHLNRPAVEVDPEILIKAASLGAKSLGIGGHAPPKTPTISEEDRLQLLANRMTNLLNQKRNEGAIDVEVKEINGELHPENPNQSPSAGSQENQPLEGTI